ncbi:MAG: TIGR02099 family protein, partial [Azoarcus sp.]|nr:TIGR02099 family protein [Azoarcus sp.]
WPPLDGAEGRIAFTSDTLRIPGVRGQMLNRPFTLEGGPSGKVVQLRARGGIDAPALRQVYDWPVLAWLGGETSWEADVVLDRGNAKLTVRSGLNGIRSRLPQPFAKEADESWPLEVVSDTPDASQPRLYSVKLGGWLDAVFARDGDGILRGSVGLNQSARLPRDGIEIAATLGELDVDAWQWSFDNESEIANAALAGTAPPTTVVDDAPFPLTGVTLDVKRLRAFGRDFKNMKLRADAQGSDWKAKVDSPEVKGEIVWKRDGEGMVTARLSRLALAAEGSNGNGNGGPPTRSLPGLDVQAEQFVVGERTLGQLEVRAVNQDGDWRLDSFTITQPDSRFSGSGMWRPAEKRSQLDFTLTTGNIGKLASSLGYANMVKGGKAKLVGLLDWNGPPTGIDYPSLSGNFTLNAEDGRFEKIEPGVGRLFGILSLQALPRRITLDFRDVFSEGLAFDSIDGKIMASNGTMSTEGIDIVGPAAKIKMSGKANIVAETQDLQVNVQPTLSESVAIGAAVANPIVGAVTYIAQKVMGDPIEKLFAYDYKITGSWAEPMVEKTGAKQVGTRVADRGALRITEDE